MIPCDEENVDGRVTPSPSDKHALASTTSRPRKKSIKSTRRIRRRHSKHQPPQGNGAESAATTCEPDVKRQAGAADKFRDSQSEISLAKQARSEEEHGPKQHRRQSHTRLRQKHKGRKKGSESRDHDSKDAYQRHNDPEKDTMVSKPEALLAASVCKAVDEHAAGPVKSPGDEGRSQPEAEREAIGPQPSVKSAHKPDTGPVERKTGQGYSKSKGTKASTSDILGGRIDARPCSSVATEERRWLRRLAGCLVFAAILCFVGAALYVAIFVLAGDAAVAAGFVRKPTRAALHPLCSGTACVRALDALTENMEDVNPCADFQRHVCGRWFSQHSRRESYEQEAVDVFLSRIHQALIDAAQQPHGHVTREFNMAKLYDSCLKFAVQEQTVKTTDVLESMGIKAEILQSIRRPGDLFRFVVGTSLSTGLPSVVAVPLRRGSSLRAPFVPAVDMGQTLLVSLHYVHVSAYLKDAVADFRVSNAEGVIAAVTKIDEAVEAWRAKADRRESFATMRLRELRDVVGGASWIEALNSGLLATGASPQFTNESAVMTRARGQIYGALAALLFGQASMEHARFYAVLLLLAQVMKYRYLLERTLERTLKDHGQCLHVTGSLTSASFTAWVTQTLVPTGAIEDLGHMVKGLKEAMVSRPAPVPELNVSDSDVAKWTVHVIGSERALPQSSAVSSLAAASAPYDDRFLLNVARASRDNVLPALSKHESTSSGGRDDPLGEDVDARTLAAWQIRGTTSYDSRTGRLFVPAVWLSNIAFVRDSAVPALDFATLGVRLLAVWIRSQLTKRPHLRENLESSSGCPWREVDTSLEDENSDEVVRKVASTEWALRLAFLASQQPLPRKDLASGVLRDRVFFWRFCQSHCGDIVSGDVCGIAVRRTRSFRDAFACRESDAALCSP
ncbi:uncharacterized protein [Dermacentor albipictus]|uniref:uncharacterized protein n=1 Tax=Dermacentor albipictus TaxID=60249 RepID=UPI0031FD9909